MNIVVPLVNGFEEIEALATVDILRRAGFNAVLAGIPGTMLTGNKGVKVIADSKFEDINPEDYQAIVLPGGEGSPSMGKSKKLVSMLRDFNDKKKLIAAICYSPMLLASEGLLDDKKATVYPGNERKIPKPRPDRVVVDGNIITSQGPGTTIEFALKIVEVLAGKDKSDKLAKGLVCR
jgi:4-methyl-5(b-hydroxyethyl)-thiazole monophosphate biosynthesis